MGEVIAVLSGKGGTGKTTLCAGLATALAARGEWVLCVDCDVGLRNLDIALGMAQTDALAFSEVGQGGYPLSHAAKHPEFDTLRFLTAPVNGTCEDIDAAHFSALLRSARQEFDYVLLDAPAGVERGFQLCARFADRILLVTCPDAAAIRDARHAGTLLESMGKAEVRLIVNRINRKLFGTMNLTVDDVMDEAGLPLLGIVPEDPNVILSAAFQKPLISYTQRGAAAACKRIAKRIQGLPVPVTLR